MTHAEEILSNCSRWRSAWNPPDRRPIYEWARENIILPDTYSIAGPFRESAWMRPIFDDLQNLKIRRVHLRKAVQQGGTLLADIWCQWTINNDPGPGSWTMQTEEAMNKHLKACVWPMMEKGCLATAKKLPQSGSKLRNFESVYFGGFFWIFNSATLSSQQSDKIRYKINDEIWLDKWQDVYVDACARVKSFERDGLSKIFNISQAGMKGDIEDKSFIEGHQGELHIKCPFCEKSSPLVFEFLRDDKTRAGIVWAEDAKQSDGYFNVARACETARYECASCRASMPENESTRRLWANSHHFITQNEKAPLAVRSYHIESLVNDRIPTIVEVFCNASNAMKRGFIADMIKFRQKQRARPWEEKGETATMRGGSREDAYIYEDYAKGELWMGEVARCLTIDRQKDHFWIEIRAWRQNGSSRQLLFARINTIEEVRIRQFDYKVPAWNVFEDSGYLPTEVYTDCARSQVKTPDDKGWINGWIALRGDRLNEFWHDAPGEPKPKKNIFYSMPSPIQHQGHIVYKMDFSNYNVKNVLERLIGGLAEAAWDSPTNVSMAYKQHCEAEQRLEKSPGFWQWEPVPRGKPNHGWDCSAMQVVFGLIRGYLNSGETSGLKAV